jgi:hypothetical protein
VPASWIDNRPALPHSCLFDLLTRPWALMVVKGYV